MNITIIGYGRMGKEVESIAISRGHGIILRIDTDNIDDFDSELFGKSDVAIEFTTPDTAFENISMCINRSIPVVTGTTGWTERLPIIEDLVESKGGSFIHSSNFSIGVNILFDLNKRLAGIMNHLHDYDVKLEEIHHIMKKDAPSGTAINLAEDIIGECNRFKSWHTDELQGKDRIGIKSVREGQVTGTHRIEWNSDVDTITIEHKAHSRQGFALGAVFAAEFIYKKKGVFTMKDLLGF
ncbi:MAG: 4-hydroxy-tetrahydrodipicolinate reductase [Bacteroidales bacterium]|nr:4-hydroxy-tetrahydrodipicolinate reductase [Bacteroidales bacterium]